MKVGARFFVYANIVVNILKNGITILRLNLYTRD